MTARGEAWYPPRMRTTRLWVSVPLELAVLLDEVAERRVATRSEVVREILRDALLARREQAERSGGDEEVPG